VMTTVWEIANFVGLDKQLSTLDLSFFKHMISVLTVLPMVYLMNC